MGAKVALFVIAFIVFAPLLLIGDIVGDWIRTGRLILELPRGFDLRFDIALDAFASLLAAIFIDTSDTP